MSDPKPHSFNRKTGIGKPLDKSFSLNASDWRGLNRNQNQTAIVYCGAMRGRYVVDGKRQDGKMLTAGLTTQRIEVRYDGKTNALTTVGKDNQVVYNPDGRSYYGIDQVAYRKLTVVECCRLQAVPDDYFKVSSNTQAYKMLGNAWQVDTIVHIFNGMAAAKFNKFDPRDTIDQTEDLTPIFDCLVKHLKLKCSYSSDPFN